MQYGDDPYCFTPSSYIDFVVHMHVISCDCVYNSYCFVVTMKAVL